MLLIGLFSDIRGDVQKMKELIVIGMEVFVIIELPGGGYRIELF